MTMAPGGEAALIFLICTQIAAVVLRLRSRRKYAVWALVLGTLPMFALIAADIYRYPNMKLADSEFAALELGVLALALLSLWPRAWFCFWLAWIANAALVGLFIYLAFFWHVFS